MRILILTKKPPYPIKDGESLAVTYLSRALRDLGAELSLLCMNTAKHHTPPADIKAGCGHFEEVRLVDVDNRLRAKDAFLNLFSSESYHVSRFVSADYGAALRDILQAKRFDIVQLETLYLAPYIPLIRQHSGARIVMRSHNVEYEIWERITENTRFLPKKWYLNHLTHKLRRFEQARFSDYDLLAAITSRDLDTYRQAGYKGQGIAIPIGIRAADYSPDYAAFRRKPSLSFIGSLDWMPNLEGLQWFLDDIWNKIHDRHPQLEFHIAGRNPPEHLLRLRQKGVTVHGEVEDAHAFINAHPIMVVPLKSGSGMRVKILESMALGRVTISTGVGMEGIHAQADDGILKADNPDDFLEKTSFCIDNWQGMEALGRAAAAFVGREFDNRAIAGRLLAEYRAE